jgi:predicted Zn-dependent protease
MNDMMANRFSKMARRVAAAGVALALAGCASMVPEESLNAQGAAMFEQLKAEIPLVTDPPTIRFVACIAEAIVGQLEGPEADYDWELAVFDQPDVNAFVLPGGKISVYSGILPVTKTPDQLAAVMGHEVAHVTQKHPQERMARTTATQYGVAVLGGIVGGTPTAARSASTALQMAAQFGLLLPFNRGQETEADEVGLIYMARAGFDPRESVKLWQNMREQKDGEPPEFLSTHPSSDTRIDQLVKMLPAALLEYNKAQAAGRKPQCVRPDIPEPEEKQK